MKKILFLILPLTVGFGFAEGVFAGDMFRAVIDGNACYATVHTEDEILIPSHCLSGVRESVSIESIGEKQIAGVMEFEGEYARDLFEKGAERMLIVKLSERLFEKGDRPEMKAPRKGMIDSPEGSRTPCKVSFIEEKKGFMAYQCASWHGRSGSLVYQEGRPVGFHLGRLKSSGLAIAALENGPRVSLGEVYGDDFEPQKLSVSCCKKLKKAVEKVGDALQDGVDSLAKVIENAKIEIRRLEDDVKSLPKVFSAEYVREKTSSIKGPRLPEFKISTVNWPTTDFDAITIPERWFKKSGKRWDQAVYMFKELGRAFVIVWEEIKGTKLGPPNLCQGCDDPPPRDICAPSASPQEKKECISNLEKELEVASGQKRETLEDLRQWLGDQKARLGVE